MDSHDLKILISFSDNVFESEDWAVRVCFMAEHTLCQVGAIYIWKDIPSVRTKGAHFIQLINWLTLFYFEATQVEKYNAFKKLTC